MEADTTSSGLPRSGRQLPAARESFSCADAARLQGPRSSQVRDLGDSCAMGMLCGGAAVCSTGRGTVAAGRDTEQAPADLVSSRGSWRAQGSGELHPALALGWKALCQVHCNGLVGDFLGGHDR